MPEVDSKDTSASTPELGLTDKSDILTESPEPSVEDGEESQEESTDSDQDDKKAGKKKKSKKSKKANVD